MTNGHCNDDYDSLLKAALMTGLLPDLGKQVKLPALAWKLPV